MELKIPSRVIIIINFIIIIIIMILKIRTYLTEEYPKEKLL